MNSLRSSSFLSVSLFFFIALSQAPRTQAASFALKDRVQATANINVRTAAFSTSTLLSVQPAGSLGTIYGGPIVAGGYTWWKIHYDSDVLGWSAENWLVRVTGDVTPPSITSVRSGYLSPYYVSISWLTNEFADGKVYYGITAAYTNASAILPQAKSHTQGLLDLTSGTLYHYKIESRDAAGNLTTSPDYVFSTPLSSSDTIPPKISIVSPGQNTVVHGVIPLKVSVSDNVHIAGVQYKIDGQNFQNENTVSPYTMSWDTTRVSDGAHTVGAVVRDTSNNSSTTPPRSVVVDNASPIISAIRVATSTQTSVTISWLTNESATAQVEYGALDSYGSSTPLNTSLLTSHNIRLSNLKQNSSYHYRLKSKDKSGNITISADQIFMTLGAMKAFTTGSRVVTLANVYVRATASTAGTSLGLIPLGSLGTVQGGPVFASGYWWWNVLYASGQNGWSVESYLAVASSSPIPSPVLDFSLFISASSPIIRGSRGTMQATILPSITPATTTLVTFSLDSGLPAGSSAVLPKADCIIFSAAGCYVSITISSASSTPVGIYPITVTTIINGKAYSASGEISIVEPFVAGDLPGAVTFTRSYNGALSANQNRRWSWQPGAGGAPTRYWVQPSWMSGFYTTSTTYLSWESRAIAKAYNTLDLATLKNGQTYTVSVAGENAVGRGPAIMDSIKINYLDAKGNDIGHGVLNGYFPTSAPSDITSFRFNFNLAESTNISTTKILFNGHGIYGPKGGYNIEEDLFNFRDEYPDPNCEVEGNNGINLVTRNLTKPMVAIDVSDYNIPRYRVGMKTFSPADFPRWVDWAIDSSHDSVNGDTSRNNMVGQMDILGKDVQIVVARGTSFTNLSGWKCDNSLLPVDIYREWDVSITVGSSSPYKVAYAVPESKGRYMDSRSLFNPVSEFFILNGHFKAYYWGMEYQRQSSTAWQSIPSWKVSTNDSSTIDYGVKLSTYNGRNVIEMSNDAPDVYMTDGTTFTLP